ncbi:AAA family ATPase [Candidatus Formimonas warabiya]|nr:AAA family ATPase [Candidatus Formimonas warabiya]
MEIKMRLNPGGRKVFETISSHDHKKEETSLLKVEKETESSPDNPKVREIFKELDNLIGLREVKKVIYEVQAFVEIQRRRAKEKLSTEPTVLHAVFKGNPGTGKTTVARIVAKLFKEIGVLQKGHLVEVERADLVGEYIGHTAQKTRDHLQKAIGGVLFIDEAYSLARGGEKDFGKEAIDVIVKAMEDHRDNLILILAGYKDEMDWFLRTNPGLRSRFPLHIDFPDYRIEELMEIANLMIKARQYQLTTESQAALERILRAQLLPGHEHSGNARLVRNIVESAMRQQAVRLMEKSRTSREDLMTLETIDILSASRRVHEH